MKTTHSFLAFAAAAFILAIGCGKSAKLEMAEKQLRDAEARAVAAEKAAVENRAAAEQARVEKEAAEKLSAEHRANTEKLLAEKQAAEAIANEQKERASKAQVARLPIRGEKHDSTNKLPSSGIVSAPDDDGVNYPSYLTAYDICTERDLYYTHLLAPLCGGDDLKKWALFKEATSHFKKTIGNFFDATVIASTITTSMPVEGNKPLARIDELVSDCARVLDVPKPNVFVRSDPVPQAYATGAQEPFILVITSGLLDLYEKSPDELRFIVGHELGHMKCRHMQTKQASVALMTILQKIDSKIAADVNVLPTLGLGYFCSWCRESEISADRAGLLCCQDPQVAYNALSRLLHGLRRESDWIDPNTPDFDADKIIEGFRSWEAKPFVEFLLDIKRYSASHPFIPERIAALKAWEGSGAMAGILSRRGDRPTGYKVVDIQAIFVTGLASGDDKVDPYVKVIQDQVVRFQTPFKQSVQSAAWADFNRPFRAQDGQPIFFEIWDSNTVKDSLCGVFAIYPRSEKTLYETGIRWDVYERSSSQRSGVAKVKLTFLKGNE